MQGSILLLVSALLRPNMFRRIYFWDIQNILLGYTNKIKHKQIFHVIVRVISAHAPFFSTLVSSVLLTKD